MMLAVSLPWTPFVCLLIAELADILRHSYPGRFEAWSNRFPQQATVGPSSDIQPFFAES
jgi:hypothetical protein